MPSVASRLKSTFVGEGYPLSEHKEKRAGERLTPCYHQYLTFHSDLLPYRISKEFQSLLELLKVQFPIIPWLREGGGGGGYSGFQVTGIIEWGQKPKPKKILRPSNKIQSGAHHCFCLFIHHSIWSYHESLILGWFSNRTTERERQLTTARANQTTGLTNMVEQFGRAANWASEVVFSPFRSLSRRQLLLNQPIVLNTRKKVYLPNFLTQKYPGVENFKAKKPRHLKSGVPTTWVIIFPNNNDNNNNNNNNNIDGFISAYLLNCS